MKVYHLAIIALVGSLTSCVTTSGPGPKAASIRHSGVSPQRTLSDLDSQYRFVQVKSFKDLPGAPETTIQGSTPAVDSRFLYSDEVAFGDVLEIRIVDASPQSPFYRSSADFVTGPFEVPEDGVVSIPYVGEVEVIGRHLADLTREVRGTIQGVSPTAEASVIRVNRMPKRAYVVGSVQTPGAVSIDREGFGILDAIAATGGADDAEHLFSIVLNRKGEQYPLTAEQLVSQRPLVMDGDVIKVEPNRALSYHVMGRVKEPGRFEFPDKDPTLMEALAQAGSFETEDTALGDPKGVFVFRQTESGEKMAYALDLTKPINTFMAQDFLLHPNDVVYVSESHMAGFQRMSRATLPIVAIMAAAAVQ